ncbi:tRNA (adenine(22)-N(1))-methyltransferase TrmK [Oceanobacillus piezotolerans]|uniref:tRNA (Adenine(22)-N(1))-methyltransferase TrmK n=1 Tax=Oceanobacillus piezotolerans TaxID=2448030 RepID=A0A498DLZ0_9BACI|nr:class I SAM-dependent methyltransferase [Oceanobacillus piezotolerans]RLL48060.1 tRNA (adenine(22)-N(1))-methyltransferase TrmK [Oceanobacillus piezotolerans]
MIQNIQLSNRLLKVASFIPKGAFFADIGSDHAYLPCYVCQKDNTAEAIAGEVNEGPYQSALQTVRTHDLIKKVDVRLGDGLQVIKDAEKVEHVVIAGMGGSLIETILEEGKSKLIHTKQIIAQPNIDARSVRRWLDDNGFTITNETIVEENGHVYEIMAASAGQQDKTPYQESIKERQLLFGPILLENKTNSFYNKWKHERSKLERVIMQMRQAKQKDEIKISLFEKELQWIEEELQDERTSESH